MTISLFWLIVTIVALAIVLILFVGYVIYVDVYRSTKRQKNNNHRVDPKRGRGPRVGPWSQ